MATQAECRSMREIMKSTLKKILVILFWITVIALGALLFWRMSDITLAFISRQNFISQQWFFWLLLVLSIASIALGFFLFICSYVSSEKDLDKESITFAVIGLIGVLLPVIERGFIALLSIYFPDGALPESLENVNVFLNIYCVILFALAMTAGAFGAMLNADGY